MSDNEKTKKQHYIPQTFLESWNVPGQKSVYWYNTEQRSYTLRNKSTIAYENYLYSYMSDELFNAPDNVIRKFKEETKIDNYEFYDKEQNLINNPLPYIDNGKIELIIKRNGREITKAEMHLLEQKIKYWQDDFIERELSNLENAWKINIVKLEHFRKTCLIRENNLIRNLVFETLYANTIVPIFEFVHIMFIRNPEYKKRIEEKRQVMQEIIFADFPISDANYKHIENTAFVNSVLKSIQHSSYDKEDFVLDTSSVDIIFLNDNQNIVLPISASYNINEKFCGMKKIKAGTYFPLSPKIILCVYENNIRSIDIVTNLGDKYVDCLNYYFIKGSSAVVANFDANTRYNLNFTRLNSKCSNR